MGGAMEAHCSSPWTVFAGASADIDISGNIEVFSRVGPGNETGRAPWGVEHASSAPVPWPDLDAGDPVPVPWLPFPEKVQDELQRSHLRHEGRPSV